MLAPLFNKMITRDVANRFTAHQALVFFEDFRFGMLPLQLNAKLPPAPAIRVNAEKYDRWEGLPQDFIQKWASYREPPIPWLTNSYVEFVSTTWDTIWFSG